MHHYTVAKNAGRVQLEKNPSTDRITVKEKIFDPRTGEDLGFDDNGSEYTPEIIDNQIAALQEHIDSLTALRADVVAKLAE